MDFEQNEDSIAKLKKLKVQIRIGTLVKLVGLHGKKCWYCQTPFTSFKEIEIDHVVPKARGGPSTLSNYAIACKCCNRAKWDMPLEDFLRWLRKSKMPLPHLIERAKTLERQWIQYGDAFEKGLRKPSKR